MSEMINRLARCEQVTEWISLFDERLVRATGQPSPNRGGGLRENWKCISSPLRLEAEIARLLIPSHVELDGEASVKFDETPRHGDISNRVLLNFCTEIDWLKCFPLGSDSQIPDFDDDFRAWAGLAMCGEVMGLAVFATEQMDEQLRTVQSIQARVQPVPMEVFGRIMES